MHINYLLAYLTLFLFCTPILNAQQTVSGTLFDDERVPLGFANVLLLTAADSTFIAGTTTADDGTFSLAVEREGSFLLRISAIGYADFTSAPFPLNGENPTKNFVNLTIGASAIDLTTVQVTAEKPVFEQRIDRTVVNVENTIAAAGGTALEVLERSPGVVVSRASNSVAMLGKDGVNVMINGKLNYLPNDALLDFLAGLNANDIQKIELITTPPANLDAQGNAGYINIVLKNNPADGFNGNYALTAGIGRGALANASLSFNYRRDRLNLFGSYAYNFTTQDQFSDLLRQSGTGDDFLETLITKERDPAVYNQNARLGLDYQIGERTTAGVLLSGYVNQWNLDEGSRVEIRPVGAPDTLIRSLNTEENDWSNLQTNLHVNHEFANATQLAVSLDYLYYNNDNPANYNQDFLLNGTTNLRREVLFSSNQTDFGIWVAKLDYNQAFAKTGKWNSGLKYVRSNFQNAVRVTLDDAILPNFTDNGDLVEGVYAAYTQAEYPLSAKTQLKAGLRYEFTDTDLTTEKDGQVVDRAFGALFPSVYLNHQLTATQQVNVSYSRRINRPQFNDMASFVFFLDPNTNFSGNASLQPALANTVQADYRFKTINLTLQYTHEDSTIARFQNRFDLATERQLILPVNLRDQQVFNVSVAFPWRPVKWWQMRYFIQYTHTAATTVDADLIYTDRLNSVFFNGNQTFTLPKDWSVELSGFWRSRQLNGNVRVDPMGVFNIGVQKKFANSSRLTFNATDVFNSLQAQTFTEIPASNFSVARLFDFSQRTFKLTYSARFGNQQVQKAREYRQAEEAKRVN